MSLLPPNSTPEERALEGAMQAGIDLSAVGTLWDPWSCPAAVLPFLAWGLSISHWDANWSEVEKRTAVAEAIPFHKIKGTRGAVEQVLARFHPLLRVVSWHEANPPRDPHTFEVRANALEVPVDFLTEEVAEAIVRDVANAKSLRDHFDFVQSLEAQAALFMAAGAMGGSLRRDDYAAEHDTSRDWDAVWQTEDGEPILTEDGTDYLETH